MTSKLRIRLRRLQWSPVYYIDATIQRLRKDSKKFERITASLFTIPPYVIRIPVRTTHPLKSKNTPQVPGRYCELLILENCKIKHPPSKTVRGNLASRVNIFPPISSSRHLKCLLRKDPNYSTPPFPFPFSSKFNTRKISTIKTTHSGM